MLPAIRNSLPFLGMQQGWRQAGAVGRGEWGGGGGGGGGSTPHLCKSVYDLKIFDVDRIGCD